MEEHVVSGDEFESAVRSVMVTKLAIPADALRQDASLSTDLQVNDDLGSELMGALGDALEVRFPDDFLDGIYTYGQLSSAVRLSLIA
jgi:acyl carrier protein